ncbi:hypothetical protein BJ912DRAFT_1052867 [Pholiota molesta]|nr:hypothetical protein BJ912DRAFT_1052867 [Pholiota molesta]
MGLPIPVIIPNLIHFRLCNVSIHRTEFSRFQLPRLETLTFYKVEYEGDGTNHPVDIPNLHSLFLVDSNISGSGISLTQLTSTITTIVLSDSRTRSSGIRPLQLLNYHDTQQGWPMLQDITVNLRNPGKFGLEFYLQCLQTRPKDPPITLRINSSLLADWRTRFAARLALLEDLCRIEHSTPQIPIFPVPGLLIHTMGV